MKKLQLLLDKIDYQINSDFAVIKSNEERTSYRLLKQKSYKSLS